MIRIAICDDESTHVKKLYQMVNKYLKRNHLNANITSYSQSEMLLYDIQDGQYFDLVLTDIEMPKTDGMELAKKIRTYLPEVLILFVTSHIKYAIAAYELSIFRYIPKSEIEKRLDKALDDAYRMLMLQCDKFYLIHTSAKTEKIPLKEIVYIQRDGKNALISCKNGTVFSVRKSLSAVLDEMNSNDFVFAERGTIINLAQILEIHKNVIQLSNGIKIQAAHTRLNEIKKKMTDFWSEQV